MAAVRRRSAAATQLGRRAGRERAAAARLSLLGRAARRIRCTCAAVELFHARREDLLRGARPLRAYRLQIVRAQAHASLLSPLYPDAQRVRRRMSRGDVCLVARSRSGCGAGVWLALGPAVIDEDWPELRRSIALPAGAAWSYDGRGVTWGAWGSLMAALPEALPELGVASVYTWIDCDNANSITSHLSLGYRGVGWVVRVGCGPLGATLAKRPGDGWRRGVGDLSGVELLPGRPVRP